MIKDISILPIFNSRGEETIKITVKTDLGVYSSCCPSGKSKGKYEVVSLDVKKILKFFPQFKSNFIGFREEDYELIDEMLEEFGGKNFSRIGGNLSITLSQAILKAAAEGRVYELLNPEVREFPYPLGNVIGGGLHGGYTDIQEFLVLPLKSDSIKEAIETNFKIWKDVKNELKRRNIFLGKNDEGALICNLDIEKILDLLSKIAENYEARIGLDIAASQLFKNGYYIYEKSDRKFSTGEQMDFLINLVKTYKLAYIEDPFHEDDFSSFSELKKRVPCIICGDDLFTTNPERLKIGIDMKSGNAVIIKPNQIGTVSKVLETVKLAAENEFHIVVSHRSGETCDTFISDLAVGVGASLIKCGIMGSERVCKLNRLIEIWNKISEKRRTSMVRLRV